MELTQIRYFLQLARSLHFTRAAQQCNVSQPALTKAIRKLEEELGGELFHRERATTQLTELGRLVLPSLEQSWAAARESAMQAKLFCRRETSPLRIGLEHSVSACVLTPVLSALRDASEDIEMSLRNGSQSMLSERMLAGEIDVGLFVAKPGAQHARIHRWKLFDEGYVVIVPPAHRFRDMEHVSLHDLSDETLLLHDDAECPMRQLASAIPARADRKVRQLRYASSQDQLQDMVHASLGVLLAGASAPAGAALHARPLLCDPLQRMVMLAAVSGRKHGPTTAHFIRLMRAQQWSGYPGATVSLESAA